MTYQHDYSQLMRRAFRGRRVPLVERYPAAALVLVTLVILVALVLIH